MAERHWRIEAGSVQPLQGGAPVKPMAWAYVVVDAFRNERGNICGTNLGKRGGGRIGGHRIEVGELYIHQIVCISFFVEFIYLLFLLRRRNCSNFIHNIKQAYNLE